MSLNLADIPDLSEPQPTPRRSRAMSEALPTPSRRTVLMTLAGAGLALGGNVLTWGMRATLPTAAAGMERSRSGLRGWTGGWGRGGEGCGRWGNGQIVSYGADWSGYKRDKRGSRFRDWQAACVNGQGPISSEYCTRRGWHRRGRVNEPPIYVDYDAVSNRCWGGASNSRNAWRWQAAPGPRGRKATFRCSDGKVTYRGDTVKTVCRARV